MGKKTYLIIPVLMMVLSLAGCRANVKSVSPDEDIRYKAEYSYGDLRVLSKEMADRILQSSLAEKEEPPVVIVFGIDNRTSEHIDTKALTDAIRTELIKSEDFRFVNEAQRDNIIKEMAYQQQGFISPETQIKVGRQVGADYLLSGSLISISQNEAKQVRVKKKSVRYYRLTLEITEIDSNLIVWTDEQEILREESRPFIGW